MSKKLFLSLTSISILVAIVLVSTQGGTVGIRSAFLNSDGNWDYSDEQGGGASTPQNVAEYVDPNTSNGTDNPSNSGASNPTNGASSTGSNGVTSCSSQQTEFDQKDSLLKEVQSKLDSITQNQTIMTARQRILESKTVDKRHPDYETIKQAIDKASLGGPGGIIDKTTMNVATLRSLLATADAKIKPIMSAFYKNTKQRTVSDWYQVHFYNQQDILLQNHMSPLNGGGVEFWSLNNQYSSNRASLSIQDLSTKDIDKEYKDESNALIKEYPKAWVVQKKIMAIWATEEKYVWPTAKKLMYPEGNRLALNSKITQVEQELVQIKADFVELPNLPQRIQTLTQERDTAQGNLDDCNTKNQQNWNGNGNGNGGGNGSGSGNKSGVCCFCAYGDNAPYGTFGKSCSEQMAELGCTKTNQAHFANDEQFTELVLDFPNACPSDKYNNVHFVVANHGNPGGQEELYCKALPVTIIDEYSRNSNKIPANIWVSHGQCNAMNSLWAAQGYAANLMNELDAAGYSDIVVTITGNQNNTGLDEDGLQTSICAGRAKFTVCSKYVKLALEVCPEVWSQCLHQDSNTTIQCAESNGNQGSRKCVDEGQVNEHGVPVGTYQM